MKEIIVLLTVFLTSYTLSGQFQSQVSAPDSAVFLLENVQDLNDGVNTGLYFKTGDGSFPYTGAIKTIGDGDNFARLSFFTFASSSPNGLIERLSISDNGRITVAGTIRVLGVDNDLRLEAFNDAIELASATVTINPTSSDDAIIQSNPDDSGGDLFLEANDAVIVRIDKNNNGNGNFFVWDDDGTNLFQVTEAGNVLVKGSTVHTSDKNSKDHFTDLNYSEVLQALNDMPIYEWQYKWEERRHIGPMAQDFHKAFGLGDDDTVIASVDADGLALAAIKAQQGIIETQDNKIAAQQSEIEELRRRMSQIENLLSTFLKSE